MTRIFGHYISLEMALLGMVELVLSFVLVQLMLVLAGEFGGGKAALDGPPAAVLAITIALCAATIGLYRPEILVERRRLLINGAVAALVAFPAIVALSELLSVTLSNAYLLWIAKVLLAWLVGLIALRGALGLAMRRKMFARRVLVLGDGARVAQAVEAVQDRRNRFFDLVGTIATDPHGTTERFGTQSHDAAPSVSLSLEALQESHIWGLVVASDRRGSMPSTELLRCKLRGIRVFDENQFWEQHLHRLNLDTVDPDWMVFADGFSSSALESSIRRLMDIAISLGFLLFTLPLMLAIAVLIKLDSTGPVFYRQERVGLHGRPFTLIKFRSMRTDAEAAGAPKWAARKDPRITRIGAFIRATRIDELPQLLNVLRGEMGFVGPRPERPHFVEELARVIPFYHERSYVKPGITGWAQVNFPYGASVEDARQKLSYDLYYVKNRSLFLDLLILVSTVRVILFQEGAR